MSPKGRKECSKVSYANFESAVRNILQEELEDHLDEALLIVHLQVLAALDDLVSFAKENLGRQPSLFPRSTEDLLDSLKAYLSLEGPNYNNKFQNIQEGVDSLLVNLSNVKRQEEGQYYLLFSNTVRSELKRLNACTEYKYSYSVRLTGEAKDIYDTLKSRLESDIDDNLDSVLERLNTSESFHESSYFEDLCDRVGREEAFEEYDTPEEQDYYDDCAVNIGRSDFEDMDIWAAIFGEYVVDEEEIESYLYENLIDKILNNLITVDTSTQWFTGLRENFSISADFTVWLDSEVSDFKGIRRLAKKIDDLFAKTIREYLKLGKRQGGSEQREMFPSMPSLVEIGSIPKLSLLLDVHTPQIVNTQEGFKQDPDISDVVASLKRLPNTKSTYAIVAWNPGASATQKLDLALVAQPDKIELACQRGLTVNVDGVNKNIEIQLLTNVLEYVPHMTDGVRFFMRKDIEGFIYGRHGAKGRYITSVSAMGVRKTKYVAGLLGSAHLPESALKVSTFKDVFVTLTNSTERVFNSVCLRKINPYATSFLDVSHVKGSVTSDVDFDGGLVLRNRFDLACEGVVYSPKTLEDLSLSFLNTQDRKPYNFTVVDTPSIPKGERYVIEITLQGAYTPPVFTTSEQITIAGYAQIFNNLNYSIAEANAELAKQHTNGIDIYSNFVCFPGEKMFSERNKFYAFTHRDSAYRIMTFFNDYVLPKYAELFSKEFFEDYKRIVDSSASSSKKANLCRDLLQKYPSDIEQLIRLRAKVEDAEAYKDNLLARILGLSSVHTRIQNVVFDYSKDTFPEVSYEYELDLKVSKNVNLLASSTLAIYAPQILARFTEHMQDLTCINKAPLGVAMDVIVDRSVTSPYEFLANPKDGVFKSMLSSANDAYLGAGSRQYIKGRGLEREKSKYFGGFRYVYSFVDFYTRPLALLYNVLLNPSQYGIRSNPYLKGKEALCATFAIKPASRWLEEYKKSLKLSQKDTSWSVLMDLETASLSNVETELSLWEQNATVFEYDELFHKDGASKFEMFFDSEKYKDSELPTDIVQNVGKSEFVERLKNNLFEYVADLVPPSQIAASKFTDPKGSTVWDTFSQKLSASVEALSKFWSFTVSTILSENFNDSQFALSYMQARNPNIMHVINLSDVFEFGIFSPGFKKILENKSVSVGEAQKAKVCIANPLKNIMPYYPMHYALKVFPRIKGSTFGALPSEPKTKTTSAERLSLGAYLTITNLIASAYQEVTRAVDVGEFGPAIATAKLPHGILCSAVQQTGFGRKGNAYLEGPMGIQSRKEDIRLRLQAMTRDYRICIGDATQRYLSASADGSSDVFSFFDEDLEMFSCVYYENGSLFEIKAQNNCVIGATPESGTDLYRYRSLARGDIARNIDLYKVQLVFNFLLFANSYAEDRYAVDLSNSDFLVCANAVLPSFDQECRRRGLQKVDFLPTAFKLAFMEAQIRIKGCEQEVEDSNMSIEDFFLQEYEDRFSNTDDDLPSLFFTEMRTYFGSKVWDVEVVKDMILENDAYFGMLNKGSVRVLSTMSLDESVLYAFKESNPTFDIDLLINALSFTEIIEDDDTEAIDDTVHTWLPIQKDE